MNLKAAELIERQTQLAQGMLEQKQQAQSIPAIGNTISDITSELEGLDDDEVAEHVKSWIEKA